jgi:hypothetical protein
VICSRLQVHCASTFQPPGALCPMVTGHLSYSSVHGRLTIPLMYPRVALLDDELTVCSVPLLLLLLDRHPV